MTRYTNAGGVCTADPPLVTDPRSLRELCDALQELRENRPPNSDILGLTAHVWEKDYLEKEIQLRTGRKP